MWKVLLVVVLMVGNWVAPTVVTRVVLTAGEKERRSVALTAASKAAQTVAWKVV